VTDKQQEKRFKATTPAKRLFKLAGMSMSIAKNVANNKVKGMFADEETRQQHKEELYSNIGAQITETLGEMKGAVMKVGQIVSQVKDLLPSEIAEALESLQKESPPMPYNLIRQQVIRSLGDDPQTLFSHFDTEPFAAASIGQVHRAITKEGVECVVKIQYPGVKESCDSDLKQIKRLFKMAGLVRISKDAMDKIFHEIRTMLHEELDYQNEADNILFFAEHYKNHPYVQVPNLIKSLSTDTILTLTYLEGDSLTNLDESVYTQEKRNQLAYRLFETMGQQMFNLRVMHCDPHPGNFACRPDGTLIIYDFGAVKRVSAEAINHHRQLVTDIFDGRTDTIDKCLTDIGVRPDNGSVVPESYYQEWLNITMPMFSSDTPYDFGTTDVHIKSMQKVRTDALKYIGAFQPSPESMQINRVLTGHYWTMVNLKAKVALRPLIQTILLDE